MEASEFCTKVSYVALAIFFLAVTIIALTIWSRNYWSERDRKEAEKETLKKYRERFEDERVQWCLLNDDLLREVSRLRGEVSDLKKLLSESERMRNLEKKNKNSK